MKQFFTILLASCLMIGNASAQLSILKNKKPLKKVRERTSPSVPDFKSRETTSAARLKSAAIMLYPSSSTHYNWSGSDWFLNLEKTYDEQGREIEMVAGLTRTVTEYDDVEETVTKWSQQKADELAPWTTFMKEITSSSDNWIYELWELVEGELAITNGSKSMYSQSTEGNTSTEQWGYMIYNPVLEDYEMASGYKDVTVVNDGGQTLSVYGYFWEDGDWVLEYTDTYTYNGEDLLTQMTFCNYEEGLTECERLEFIFSGAGAPASAMVYTDEGSGYELTGRYINLEWQDWENVSFEPDNESVVLFATMQIVLNPDGDLNSDDNYENFEQSEYDLEGNYTHQYWINGAWVTDEFFETVTAGNGEITTTAYSFDFEEGIDEDCGLFLVGDKQVATVGTSQTTITDYEWTKTSEPCGYEWAMVYEEIETTTANTHETITRYMQAEMVMEDIELEERNEHGHPVLTRSTTSMAGVVIDFMEYAYDNTYEEGLRTSAIITTRDEQEGDFLPFEKIEYAYGQSTFLPQNPLTQVGVYPTLFKEGFYVRLSNASSLKLISAKGQTVWQQAPTSGQLFVPANHLPQGVYILLISSETGKTETHRLIKK